MKKLRIILTFILALIISKISFAQYPCIRNISTNPDNPYNSEWISMFGSNEGGSFINSWFTWYPTVFTLQIPISDQNWERPPSFTADVLGMLWPFDEQNDDLLFSNSYLYSQLPFESDRDFHWEDGWELLWMNIGNLPNGTRIDQKPANSWYPAVENPLPKNMPYFVLYNRYRGTIRIFANLWKAHGFYDHVNLQLRFHTQRNDEYSGVLRNANGLDVPLDKKTEITVLEAPRRFRAIDESQWYVIDMQLAYDPCQCKIPSKFGIRAEGITILNVDLESREVSIEQEITKLDQNQKNWLQFQQSDPSTINLNEPGNVIYKSIQGLKTDFDELMTKYNNDLNDYNSFKNTLKREVFDLIIAGASGAAVVAGFGPVYDYLKEDSNYLGMEVAKEFTKQLTNAGKKILADELDFVNIGLDIKKDKPIRPQVPVATFSEGRIKGTIDGTEIYYAAPLSVPGTRPTAYNSSTDQIRSHNFPAYNNVVGLFALLETPKLRIYDKPVEVYGEVEWNNWVEELNQYNQTWTGPVNFPPSNAHLPRSKKELYLKLADGLHYTLNPALDWDFEKTEMLFAFQFEFIFEEGVDLEYWDFINTNINNQGGNFELSHRLFGANGQTTVILTSNYYNIEDAKKIAFYLNMTNQIDVNAANQSLHNPYDWGTLNNILNFINTSNSLQLGRIKLKIAGDFYFNQLGYDGEQVNTFQVFTYDLFNAAKGEALETAITDAGGTIETNTFWMSYTPGTIEIDDEIISPTSAIVDEVTANIIYVRAENIDIIGTVGAAPGYTLELVALNSVNIKPGGSLLPNSRAYINKNVGGTESNPQASAAFIENFCSNGDYKANQASDPAMARMAAEQKIEEERKAKAKMAVSLYPNPASSYVQIEVKNQPQETQSMQLVLLDIAGRPVLQRQEKANSNGQYSLNLPQLSQGIYMLQITVGQQTTVEKLVIK